MFLAQYPQYLRLRRPTAKYKKKVQGEKDVEETCDK